MTYPRIWAGYDLNLNKYEVMKYGMFNLKPGDFHRDAPFKDSKLCTWEDDCPASQ